MIKVVAPNMALVRGWLSKLRMEFSWLPQRVIDRAIQAFGAAGLSEDFGLAAAFAGARALRIADGPDEVLVTIPACLLLVAHFCSLTKGAPNDHRPT